MRHFFYIKTTSILIHKASHSISKVFVKSGNYINRAKIKFFFNKLNVCSCSLPHLNPTEFLTIQLKVWLEC